MPLQNRVLPNGEIVTIPERGTLTGNRGIIHREDRTLGRSRWSHHAWICCTLEWQGRRRKVMTGRNWTELFFLDEAVAFAAGHRPCGYCRRDAYERYVRCWSTAVGQRPKAPEMDKALHKARVVGRTRDQKTHTAEVADLPDGVFVLIDEVAHLIQGDAMWPFDPSGYQAPVSRRGSRNVTVLTPVPTVAVLAAGYQPFIHSSAGL